MQETFLTFQKARRCAGRGGLRACARFWMAAAFLIVLAAAPLRAETLEPVDLDVSQEEGYGRIVLTFKDRTLLPIYDA